MSGVGFGVKATPSSNTGLNSFITNQNTLGLDWVQGTCSLTRTELVCLRGEIASAFADSFDVDKGYFFSGRKFDANWFKGKGIA